MDKQELTKRVMAKPELKELPVEDVEMAISLCAKKGNSDEENIDCARQMLHGAYGAFSSRKLFVTSSKHGQIRERTPEWILKKHLSTRERLPHYNEIYDKILINSKMTIFDLGAGVNGFSLGFIPKVKYVGIEGIGQLVNLMNMYFKKQKLDAKAIHLSLFQLEKIKSLIKKEKGKKVVFLFKVLDSLETLKRDYSKNLLLEVTPLVERVVVSLATRSMISRKPFNVKRSWIVKFIQENFKITKDFDFGGERYIIFEKKKE
ncbi:MAG: hypothetical protein AABX26_00400 [Nanoarchaeota archaeon]